jgi:hypothetical protein
MISGFCHDVDETCTLLGYHAASSGKPLLMFWDNVLVPPSSVKKSFLLGLLDPSRRDQYAVPKRW